ncbi:hypothetical protein [Bifidobacterium parmae]|uniref:Uncharacterized protein n=1 Tax=Bifidobacterium parmae TaxID=361854 RepID=A0A2N5IWB4_9BIFI|nr:hypothetical protein [Bifidobacterium parmae]PLS26248.1 hypothetical protein Uis4E_1823 [Bifidobacterium parmae]
MGFNQVSLAYQHHEQLAAAMISLLRRHGDSYDADLAQDLLDHDGPGMAVETCCESIMEQGINPASITPLFTLLREEDDVFREESQEFHEYLQNRSTEIVPLD